MRLVKEELIKLKKIIALLLTTVLILNLSVLLPGGTFTASALNVIVSDGYSFDKDTGAITDYTGSATNLVIPSVIDGVLVTVIDLYAFDYCSTITSVIIPDSVITIDYEAFYGCPVLQDVIIGNGVTSIGHQAFADCPVLESVTIGSEITIIDPEWFRLCTSLVTITVVPENEYLSSDADFVYNKDKTELVFCLEMRSGEVSIPNGVLRIGEEAFLDCALITSVIIPDSVISIGDSAFLRCELMSSISIGNNVQSIGLLSFAVCSALTNVILPQSVTSLGEGSFYGCYMLESINIPASVTSIGIGSFEICVALQSITVDADNANYSSLSGVLYNKDKTELIVFPGGKTGSVTVINGVEIIGAGAFTYCVYITDVTLPNSVQSIGYHAFDCAQSLTRVTIPNSAVIFDDDAFNECDLVTIYGQADSTAQSYAIEEDIPFFIISNNTQSSTMEYQVASSYIVVIPASITIGESGGTIEISSDSINTLPNEQVTVKIGAGIDSEGIMSLNNQADSITSVLSNAQGVINSTTVLASFQGLITTEAVGGTVSLSKPNDTLNKKAGTYTGLLTFTIALSTIDN